MSALLEKRSLNPKIFTDLVGAITGFDAENRALISESVRPASTLEEFIQQWSSLSIKLSDGTQAQGSVDTTVTRRESEHTEIHRYLCRLSVKYNDTEALQLQFWARPTPSLSHETYQSPMRLYNTKVNVTKVTGFAPFKYYDSIMFLIKSMLPAETKLLLYVRQRDSREQLDAGADPRLVPLSIVFQKAGWKFIQYFDEKITKDPLRRHKLVLST